MNRHQMRRDLAVYRLNTTRLMRRHSQQFVSPLRGIRPAAVEVSGGASGDRLQTGSLDVSPPRIVGV